jgi:hypothetical protein
MKFSKEIILLADIVNYSLKGVTAALGKGGKGITTVLVPISFHVEKNWIYKDFINAILSTNLLEEGDILVIPSKIIAILEKRFVYGLTIKNYHKCISDLKFAIKNLKTKDKEPLTERDLIGLDKIDPIRKIGARYPKNPNQSAYRIAKLIQKKINVKVDVVISDSDSGGKKGIILIGCPTIIATPIGATRGVKLFYCMRTAVAAELIWNNVDNIPVVLIKPYQASRLRENIGKFRYKGFLNANKEEDIISILKPD